MSEIKTRSESGSVQTRYLKSKNMSKILEFGNKSLDLISELTGKKAESVISVMREGSEWRSVVEALERKSIPDTMDYLGRYELRLDDDGELLGFKQILIRRRGETLDSTPSGEIGA